LIFLATNDDGVEHAGLAALTDLLRHFGESQVVAPLVHHSGCSHRSRNEYEVAIEFKGIHTDRAKTKPCRRWPKGRAPTAASMAIDNTANRKPIRDGRATKRFVHRNGRQQDSILLVPPGGYSGGMLLAALATGYWRYRWPR